MTSLGWSLLGVGVLLGVLAVLLGWVELAIMAVTALVLVALGVLVSLGRHRADVDLVVEPLRAEIGDLAQGHVVLTNASRRTMLPSLVRLPVGDAEEVIAVPLLRKGAQHRISFPIGTPRRGVIPVGPRRRSSVTRSASPVARRPSAGSSSCMCTRGTSRSSPAPTACCVTSRAR